MTDCGEAIGAGLGGRLSFGHLAARKGSKRLEREQPGVFTPTTAALLASRLAAICYSALRR